MIFFWLLLYNVLYPFAFLIVIIFAFFNLKIRESIIGKINTLSKLKSRSNKLRNEKSTYWFHASSLGEYFQVITLIEHIKNFDPGINIVLSFTSPSGYKNAKNDCVDLKLYLPFDFVWLNYKMFNFIKPTKIIFTSYDIWLNFLFLAKIKGIETILTSLSFDEKSSKNNIIYNSYYKSIYKQFDSIHLVSKKDEKKLRSILGQNFKNSKIYVSGNPRIDYINDKFQQMSKHNKKLNILERDNLIIIASTHKNDDKIIIPTLVKILNKNTKWKVLYFPHEPLERKVKDIKLHFIKKNFDVVIVSDHNIKFSKGRVFIISSIGLLTKIYWKGKIAYVGGGFSTGIHNVMEPALSHLPILMGPKYGNSPDAKQLIKYGGAVTVKDSNQLLSSLNKLIRNKEKLSHMSKISIKTIKSNLGATKKIIKDLVNE